eukprot:scaffold278628_cov26-Tisochrysis_lutea.AAC.1
MVSVSPPPPAVASTTTSIRELLITVPAGVSPGQQLIVTNPFGGKLQITVPSGVSPGQQLRVQVRVPVTAPTSVAAVHPPPPPPPPPPVVGLLAQMESDPITEGKRLVGRGAGKRRDRGGEISQLSTVAPRESEGAFYAPPPPPPPPPASPPPISLTLTSTSQSHIDDGSADEVRRVRDTPPKPTCSHAKSVSPSQAARGTSTKDSPYVNVLAAHVPHNAPSRPSPRVFPSPSPRMRHSRLRQARRGKRRGKRQGDLNATTDTSSSPADNNGASQNSAQSAAVGPTTAGTDESRPAAAVSNYVGISPSSSSQPDTPQAMSAPNHTSATSTASAPNVAPAGDFPTGSPERAAQLMPPSSDKAAAPAEIVPPPNAATTDGARVDAAEGVNDSANAMLDDGFGRSARNGGRRGGGKGRGRRAIGETVA